MARFLLLGVFLGCSLILACSPSCLDEYRKEGERITNQVADELGGVETREELLGIAAELKKKFNKLVDLIIEAREFQWSHPEATDEGRGEAGQADRLRYELNRIYNLEGGREVLESCQKEALDRLDAFEKKYLKRRSK